MSWLLLGTGLIACVAVLLASRPRPEEKLELPVRDPYLARLLEEERW